MTKTHVSEERLRALFSGALDEQETTLVLEHLSQCVACEELSHQVWKRLKPEPLTQLEDGRENDDAALRERTMRQVHALDFLGHALNIAIINVRAFFLVILVPFGGRESRPRKRPPNQRGGTQP